MKTHTITRYIALLLLMLTSIAGRGQTVGVKTDLLSDLTTSVNLGVEVGVSPSWTVALTSQVNPWTFADGKRWKHWDITPELRYWLCDRFSGHFLGVNASAGQYNIGGISGLPDFLGTDFSKLADNRYQGWYAGAGVVYGYDWILGKHWNLEALIGLGWRHARYDQYPCATCGTKLKEGRHNYVGPTKAQLNLTYIF